MWRDVEVADRTANYNDPHLKDHLTGATLTMWINVLRKENSEGEIATGTVRWKPHAVSASPAANPTQVILQDCSSDASWLLRHRDGSLIDNTPGGDHLVKAAVVLANGTWKVSELAVGGVGTCSG
jgi:hypothetical protein